MRYLEKLSEGVALDSTKPLPAGDALCSVALLTVSLLVSCQ